MAVRCLGEALTRAGRQSLLSLCAAVTELVITGYNSRLNTGEQQSDHDGDMQDPPAMIQDFWRVYYEGYDVVYTIRKKS